MAQNVILADGPEDANTTATREGGAKTAAETAPKKRIVKSRPALLFIDTNIFLDFYRARNDAGISLLSRIDSLHDRIITTCQVEMEFKKNRQKVISESVTVLKPPDFNLSTPAFLADAATVKVMKSRIEDVKTRVDKLKSRILATLENPKTQDRIYQTMQRLFTNGSALNLQHETPQYRLVWRRAIRRFLEGRPPRKKEDTSAGDAVNWEWIVECVRTSNRDVIIVSRDADYGLTLAGRGYVNNWLAEEIKRRVNQQRKLILVDRLSAALKLLDVKVTREEITSERLTIKAPVSIADADVETVVHDALYDLLNGEELASLIARTNTCGWHCDEYGIDRIARTDGVATVHVSFTFSGEQEDDKPWHGDAISGRCIVEMDAEKNVATTVVEARLNTADDSGDDYIVDDPGEEPPNEALGSEDELGGSQTPTEIRKDSPVVDGNASTDVSRS